MLNPFCRDSVFWYVHVSHLNEKTHQKKNQKQLCLIVYFFKCTCKHLCSVTQWYPEGQPEQLIKRICNMCERISIDDNKPTHFGNQYWQPKLWQQNESWQQQQKHSFWAQLDSTSAHYPTSVSEWVTALWQTFLNSTTGPAEGFLQREMWSL